MDKRQESRQFAGTGGDTARAGAAPIAFAHRGGMAHGPENRLSTFREAARRGATAMETDAWLTKDGVVVLHHDLQIRHGLRRLPITAADRRELPRRIPTLDAYYAACGTNFDLSVDIKDEATAIAVIAGAHRAGGDAVRRLWLAAGTMPLLAAIGAADPTVHRVFSPPPDVSLQIVAAPAPWAAKLAQAGIDVLNLRQEYATQEVIDALHRAGVLAFGWDAHDAATTRRLVTRGIDGVYGNNVDVLRQAMTSPPARALD